MPTRSVAWFLLLEFGKKPFSVLPVQRELNGVAEISEELLGAFVGWLLIWRLIVDQAEHDLSSRFGDNSSQLASFRLARKNAYDSSSAYRVVEALRNLIQHREMPSLTLNRNEALDHGTGQRQRRFLIVSRWPICSGLRNVRRRSKNSSRIRRTWNLTFLR